MYGFRFLFLFFQSQSYTQVAEGFGQFFSLFCLGVTMAHYKIESRIWTTTITGTDRTIRRKGTRG